LGMVKIFTFYFCMDDFQSLIERFNEIAKKGFNNLFFYS
jgi:hypothetical protein